MEKLVFDVIVGGDVRGKMLFIDIRVYPFVFPAGDALYEGKTSRYMENVSCNLLHFIGNRDKKAGAVFKEFSELRACSLRITYYFFL